MTLIWTCYVCNTTHTHHGQDSAWTKLLTLNLQRVFNLTQKCLPLLRAAAEQGGQQDGTWRDPARIINVRPASLAPSPLLPALYSSIRDATCTLRATLTATVCALAWVGRGPRRARARDVRVLGEQGRPTPPQPQLRRAARLRGHHQQHPRLRPLPEQKSVPPSHPCLSSQFILVRH